MANALKPGAPLAFTYHHNKLEAYYPIAVAILDAGLSCTASLPCPAEMGASIHINGTGSSIIDTIFVCRKTAHAEHMAGGDPLERLRGDEQELLKAGVKLTEGDRRCMLFGHLTRVAIEKLGKTWSAEIATEEKLRRVAAMLSVVPSLPPVESRQAVLPLFDSLPA
jgi:adenine-specific DNA methylase